MYQLISSVVLYGPYSQRHIKNQSSTLCILLAYKVEWYLRQVPLLKLTHYEGNRRTCLQNKPYFCRPYCTALHVIKFTLFVPCVIPAHEATSRNCVLVHSYPEMASPTFSLTDILIRGRQTNSKVIVSGVPSRRKKNVGTPDRRLDLPMLYRLSYEASTGAGRDNLGSESRLMYKWYRYIVREPRSTREIGIFFFTT